MVPEIFHVYYISRGYSCSPKKNIATNIGKFIWEDVMVSLVLMFGPDIFPQIFSNKGRYRPKPKMCTRVKTFKNPEEFEQILCFIRSKAVAGGEHVVEIY